MIQYVMITGDSNEITIMYNGINKIRDAQLIQLKRPRYIMNRITKKLLNNSVKKQHKISSIAVLLRHYFDSAILDVVNSDNDKIVFIIAARIYDLYGSYLTDYLRNKFINCRIYCYFADLIGSFDISLDYYKKDFDHIYTFDLGESKRYGIKYCLQPFSYKRMDYQEKFSSDITFVGKAKGRLPLLHNLYHEFSARGLKCDFYIYGVPAEEQLVYSDIKYNYDLSFEKLLEHVISSRCVLEVVQDGAFSPTVRYAEAMLYNRNLLTNCKIFIDPQNREYNIMYFEHIDDIDYEWLKTPHHIDNNRYTKFFSCENFINVFREEISCED